MASYGFLTDHDRDFLRGEIEYEGESAAQNRAQKQYRIRKNTQQAFRDFGFLWQHKDKIDQTLLFNTNDEEMHESIIELLSFIFRNLGSPQQASELLEFLMEEAIRLSEYDRDRGPRLVDINVDIDSNVSPGLDINIDRIRQTLDESPEKLTPNEIGILAIQNELDVEDLQQIQEENSLEEVIASIERTYLMEYNRDDPRYANLPWIGDEEADNS